MESLQLGEEWVRLEYWTKITSPVFGDPLDVPIVRRWGQRLAQRGAVRSCINDAYSDFVSVCLQSVVDARPDLPMDSILAVQREICVELGLNMSFCELRGTYYMVEFKTFVNGQLI